MSTPEDVERISVLMGVSDTKTKHLVGHTLSVVGVIVDWGAVGTAEDGEEIQGLRGHILLDDGKSVFTTSNGILRALRMALRVYGNVAWEPAILLEVRAVQSRRGEALIGVLRGRKAPAGKKANK